MEYVDEDKEYIREILIHFKAEVQEDRIVMLDYIYKNYPEVFKEAYFDLSK